MNIPRDATDVKVFRQTKPSSLKPPDVVAAPRSAVPAPSDRAPDFDRLALEFSRCVDQADLETFSKSLGVTRRSLLRLGIGWDREQRCWTFPERDAEGWIIGISKRSKQGRKFMESGSKRGLIYPIPLFDRPIASFCEPVLIVEGTTCTAAGLDLGCLTIGRPSATGGLEFLREMVRDCRVVIVGENDAAGRLGATKIATGLAPVATWVRIIKPPEGFKDLRQWSKQGAT